MRSPLLTGIAIPTTVPIDRPDVFTINDCAETVVAGRKKVDRYTFARLSLAVTPKRMLATDVDNPS